MNISQPKLRSEKFDDDDDNNNNGSNNHNNNGNNNNNNNNNVFFHPIDDYRIDNGHVKRLQ